MEKFTRPNLVKSSFDTANVIHKRKKIHKQDFIKIKNIYFAKNVFKMMKEQTIYWEDIFEKHI